MTDLPPMDQVDTPVESDPSIPPVITPPPPPEIPAPTANAGSKPLLTPMLKKILIIAITIIVSLLVIGTIYRFVTSRSSSPKPSATPVAQSSPEPTQISEMLDLRLNRLAIPYPADWLVLFSPILDAKNPETTPLYFVRNQTEYLEHALCASTGSCTSTPLTVRFSADTQIWTGYSLGDYIRTTDPDYPLDSLSEIKMGPYVGLAGFTDYQELTYQALIPTSDTTFQKLYVVATEDSRQMLTSLVSSLETLSVITPSTIRQPRELSVKNTFKLKLTARISTTDYNVLSLVMENLFPPLDASSSASFILYTESSTPRANYLDYTYYLLTDSGDLKPGDYSTSQITAIVTETPIADFAPYLEDPKFCRENTDCVYRSDFCSFDSYNRYHLFRTPWGCGAIDYVGMGDSVTLSDSLDCDDGLDITYESLECVETQCVVNNPVPVCIEETN